MLSCLLTVTALVAAYQPRQVISPFSRAMLYLNTLMTKQNTNKQNTSSALQEFFTLGLSFGYHNSGAPSPASVHDKPCDEDKHLPIAVMGIQVCKLGREGPGPELCGRDEFTLQH